MAVLDDHDPVGMAMAPAFVPAVIAMFAEFGAGAVVMVAVPDHEGFGACNRRRGNGDRAKGCNDVTRLLHVVLSSFERGLNIASGGTFPGNTKRILNTCSAAIPARTQRTRPLHALMLRRSRAAVGGELAVLDAVFVL